MVDNLTDLIGDSQICQRNWDLSEEIPTEHICLIMEAITECPTRQNIPFFDVTAITDRSVIEDIHKCTAHFKIVESMANSDYPKLIAEGAYRMKKTERIADVKKTNPQVLGQLLIAFSANMNTHYTDSVSHDPLFSSEGKWEKDVSFSIGIAAGYAKLISTQLGYASGFCGCYDEGINKILGKDIRLMLGIGIPDRNKPHTEHHYESFEFPSFKEVKNLSPVNVEYVG